MTKPRIIACESVGCPGPRAAAFIVASEPWVFKVAPDARDTWAICTGCYAQWEQVAREADHPSALRVVRAVEAMAPERLR